MTLAVHGVSYLPSGNQYKSFVIYADARDHSPLSLLSTGYSGRHPNAGGALDPLHYSSVAMPYTTRPTWTRFISEETIARC